MVIIRKKKTNEQTNKHEGAKSAVVREVEQNKKTEGWKLF